MRISSAIYPENSGGRAGDHKLLCGDARDPEIYTTLPSDERARLMFAEAAFCELVYALLGAQQQIISVEGRLELRFSRSTAMIAVRPITSGFLLSLTSGICSNPLRCETTRLLRQQQRQPSSVRANVRIIY
jgi:hypothetical protein